MFPGTSQDQTSPYLYIEAKWRTWVSKKRLYLYFEVPWEQGNQREREGAFFPANYYFKNNSTHSTYIDNTPPGNDKNKRTNWSDKKGSH
jgi:cell division protein YceG involved in septum cleavage